MTGMQPSVNEEWAPLPDFEGEYQISSEGIIRSIDRVVNHSSMGGASKRGRTLRSKTSHRGYMIIKLNSRGVAYTRSIHRLLAMAFIPNPEHKPFVNHKNGRKDDNRLENLEWSTPGENMRHAYLLGLKKPTNQFIKRCAEEEIATAQAVQ